MSRKTEKFVLWNVPEQRIESLHESKEAAELAEERYVAKSGAYQDHVDLQISSFSARLPEPAPATEETRADEKKRAEARSEKK